MFCFFFTLFALFAFAEAPLLRGIVLISDEKELLLPEDAALMEGVHTEKISLPGTPRELEQSLSSLCFNQPINSETIGQIKKEIYAHYEKNQQPLALVSIPAQNISSGVLQVVSALSRLNEVYIRGGKGNEVLRILPFASGDEIHSDELQKNLNFFNRNPFRRGEIIFSPGSLPRTTDLTLVVDQGRPFRLFGGTDNTGVASTWEGRVFSGVHFTALSGEVYGTFAYNASYDFHRSQTWSTQLTVNLPWKHMTKLTGSYSLIHPITANPQVKHQGMSDQVSLRYIIPSLDHEKFRRDFSLGYDFKQMNNILEYAMFAPSYSETRLVTVSQLALEYSLSFQSPRSSIDLQLSAFASPGELFPHQSESDFETMSAGAKSLYAYLNGFFKVGRTFRFGTLSLTSSAQLATGSLLPSEQVGIGGFGTVRGYDERQYNADQALLGSIEWEFPSWPLLSLFNRKKITDEMHLLFFADGAYGMTYHENSSSYLLSIGPGLRYNFPPYLSLRLDLGFRLHEAALFVGDFYKWHFNLTGSY